MHTRFPLPFILFALSLPAARGGEAAVSLKIELGRRLFFDTSLSNPPGQSCSSCHDPDHAFTDPDRDQPTSDGVLSELKGSRNTPTALYASFSPPFHFDRVEGLFVGGQFLDGRALGLKKQAKGPFLNPLEMANPDRAAVVAKVRAAEYAPLFERVYGSGALERTVPAYQRIVDAIAAFEKTPRFHPFTSKYDYFLRGQARFTDQELHGRKLFEAEDKGNCAACHPSRPAEDGTPPLFTDHTYDNLGVPKNPDNPFYSLPAELNPKGYRFVDKGLGGSVHRASENGKFKVPTLRNIALTAPYMHNGYFRTLRGVVEFYSNRDTKPVCPSDFTTEADALRQGCWSKPEVARNVNRDELGDLNLSEEEIEDLTVFLNTLTDGYQPE